MAPVAEALLHYWIKKQLVLETQTVYNLALVDWNFGEMVLETQAVYDLAFVGCSLGELVLETQVHEETLLATLVHTDVFTTNLVLLEYLDIAE